MKKMLIDNHSHLQHEKFDNIRESIVKRCAEEMRYVVVSGANDTWNRKAVEIFSSYKGESSKMSMFLITLGIHPVESVKMSERAFEYSLEFIKKSVHELDNVIAIGEIGLDYHWVKDKAKHAVMKERFIMQIELADELSLPIVTHSWDAEKDVISIASNYKNDGRVIMHCFSSHKHVSEVKENGFFVGVCTNIVRNKSVKKVVKNLDIRFILTESDAPYLSPSPSEELNYPWNVAYVTKKISEIKKMSEEKVREEIYDNFLRAYALSE